MISTGIILETANLRLRKFTLNDAGFIIALMNSPGWIRFIGDRHIRTIDQARRYLENGPLQSYVHHGYGLYLVERQRDEASVGMCGLLRRDYLEQPDIGFAFLPGFTGQGYARESADAVLQYAKGTLGIPEVWAITMPENDRSIRLLQHLGMVYKGVCLPPGSAAELSLYTTERGPWKKATRQS